MGGGILISYTTTRFSRKALNELIYLSVFERNYEFPESDELVSGDLNQIQPDYKPLRLRQEQTAQFVWF